MTVYHFDIKDTFINKFLKETFENNIEYNSSCYSFNDDNYIRISSISDNIKPRKNIVYTNILNKNSLIQLAYEYMCQYGFYNINPDVYSIEFHRYYCLEDESIESVFNEWHQDDYGAIDCEVNTCIFYINKADTLSGGNLIVKMANHITSIKTYPDEYMRCVLLDGRTDHYVENMYGHGCRDCIVIQFKRI